MENAPSTHNGWAVVTPSAPSVTTSNNKIEKRNDVISPSLTNHAQKQDQQSNDEEDHQEEATDSEAQKFDIDSFQPELHGGFRPILSTSPVGVQATEKVAKHAANADDSIDALVYEDLGSKDDAGTTDRIEEHTISR